MSSNAFVIKQQGQSLLAGGTSIRVSNEGSFTYEHVDDEDQIYSHYEESAKKCLNDNENPKRRKNLLHFRDMPPHLQFNPYIFTGYRPLLTFWGSINSLFYLHNETINILTHGIPIVYILVTVPGLMPWDHIESRFLPWCHIIGAVSPWIGSFVYHLFMNLERGEVVYYKLLQLDMLGIWISQSFGALPMVYASVFCLSWACRWLILSSYCLLSMWGLYKALTAWSPWERRLCFLLPFVMRVLVVMAVYSMHQATVRDLLWMAHVDCRTQNQPTDTFGGLQAAEEL